MQWLYFVFKEKPKFELKNTVFECQSNTVKKEIIKHLLVKL